ncbi:MAG: hypothetical protein V7K26_14535 [Nostoc sp.]|uniref:hypothetical protein n=1 Tax=Nostoc sp. TaxID=1180 RepID=UPI002FF17E57
MKLFCTSVYTIFGGNAAYLYVIKNEDISTHIAPTIDLCGDSFRTFGLKTVKYITGIMAIAIVKIPENLRQKTELIKGEGSVNNYLT